MSLAESSESSEGEKGTDNTQKTVDLQRQSGGGQTAGTELIRLSPEQLEELIQKIRAEVQRLDAAEPGSVFRGLCRLAVTWNVQPETFRRVLIRAGFTESRASEIKIVLADDTQRVRFLRGEPWKECLKKARTGRQSSLAKLAARLLRATRQHAQVFPSGQPLGQSGWVFERDDQGQLRFCHAGTGETLEILHLLPNFPLAQ
jgi:hypothetical protein